jgi:hypothetical protein
MKFSNVKKSKKGLPGYSRAQSFLLPCREIKSERMKKAIFFVAAILITISTEAQVAGQSSGKSLFIGPVAGFGHSRVTNLDGVTRFKPMAYVGVNIIHEVSGHFTFGNSFILSSEGYKIRNEGSEISVTPKYLRMPFRATYAFGHGRIQPAAYAGPVFGVKLGESSSENRVIDDMFLGEKSKQFNNVDFGLNAGIGVNIRMGDRKYLTLDGGYYQGLLDVVKDAASVSNKNQNLTFNVGLLFAVGGTE